MNLDKRAQAPKEFRVERLVNGSNPGQQKKEELGWLPSFCPENLEEPDVCWGGGSSHETLYFLHS